MANDVDVDVGASSEDRMSVGTTQADADTEASGADAEDTAEHEVDAAVTEDVDVRLDASEEDSVKTEH